MKKPLKRILSAFAALTIALTFTLHAFADTYYTYGGYTYTKADGNNIIIFAVDADDYSKVSFPNNIADNLVYAVGDFAFSGDEELTEVSCENATHMTEILAFSFENCNNLTSFKLSPSVQYLGIGAFDSCTALTSFDWADCQVDEILTQTFYKCTSLEYMELPDSVTEIYPHAFAGCTSLKEITIGRNVTEISDTAFKDDDQLTIACWEDSYAYQYAVDHNIPVRFLHEVKLGDANTDGSVNINDVTAIQAHKAEMSFLTDLQQLAADVNYDGKVDIADATLLQSFLAEFEVDYAVNTTVTR